MSSVLSKEFTSLRQLPSLHKSYIIVPVAKNASFGLEPAALAEGMEAINNGHVSWCPGKLDCVPSLLTWKSALSGADLPFEIYTL